MSDKVKIQKKFYGTTQVKYDTKTGTNNWTSGNNWADLQSQTPQYYGINATTTQCYRITRRVERRKLIVYDSPVIYVITTVLKYNKDGDAKEVTKQYKYSSGVARTEDQYNTESSMASSNDTKMVTEVFVNIANTKDSLARDTDAEYKTTELPPGYVINTSPYTATGSTSYTNTDSGSVDTTQYESETLKPLGF
ncbi:MAG: hypothetical protein CBC02_008390 [Flavobacteriaceae bacterium TMED42]|nr:MAG: hypothetical protein CBC02_008390 [Flavobacteriaceae bacterium TMED42]|tara:strand:+ start:743 stop:1324 length:582 start_codon:yes stop_codon:yes gene_type:complete